jgi:hypothetical protein
MEQTIEASDEVPMRRLIYPLLAFIVAALGCPAAGAPTGVKSGADQTGTNAAAAAAHVPQQPAGEELSMLEEQEIPPERRVWAYIDGQRRAMDIDQARSVGLTVVDLSDDWVPFIFWSQTPGQDDYKPNQYLSDYVQLANDKINLDGAELGPDERNYLEVYGIPPSLSVLRRRFAEDEQRACLNKLDYALFSEYHGPIRVVDGGGSRRLERNYKKARAAYRKALRVARVRSLEALLQRPAHRKVAQRYRTYLWRRKAVRAMKKRLRCEGMLSRKARTKPGVIDWTVRQALRRFERKHNVYGWGMVFQPTSDALGRTALQNNVASVRRVLAERVVSATGILEDGTVRRGGTFVAADGSEQEVRNLVDEFSTALLHHMGLTNDERIATWITGQSEEDSRRLLVAVPLPPVPEYYGDQMELSAVIDRGDVWYDLPFDDEGKRVGQPRRKMPKLTLYVTYREQKIPLIYWQTTIGGWNAEMRGDEEFYKYKVSDIGPRIWRNIIAGPVWVPPKVTPPRDMVKGRAVRGRAQRVVGSSTFGPGYASAYGLVAAFHVTENGFDNQIRTHGSVNYMSILSRYSHGCHRLFNYRAVRLFSFILRHRQFKRKGQTRIAFKHRFEFKGEEFQINLHTRGYYYALPPPVPVDVLEGRIRGKLKEPVDEYVKKPGRVYQEDLPSTDTEKHQSTMGQRQTL